MFKITQRGKNGVFKRLVCKYCNKTVLKTPYKALTLKYCSKECVHASQQKRKNRKCLTCGVFFRIPISRIKLGWGKYCSHKCTYISRKKWAPSYFRKLGLKGLVSQQESIGPTSIEKKVYEELKKRGFIFERQKIIGDKFAVDAYIPSLNLVIECDGSYWHSLPSMQLRDKRKDAYLNKCGYELLRLGEGEIRNGTFKDKLNKICFVTH